MKIINKLLTALWLSECGIFTGYITLIMAILATTALSSSDQVDCRLICLVLVLITVSLVVTACSLYVKHSAKFGDYLREHLLLRIVTTNNRYYTQWSIVGSNR